MRQIVQQPMTVLSLAIGLTVMIAPMNDAVFVMLIVVAIASAILNLAGAIERGARNAIVVNTLVLVAFGSVAAHIAAHV